MRTLAQLTGLALQWRFWALPYFVSSAMAIVISLLVQSRGRGELRRPLMALLASVSATLFATGCVFLAADAHTARLLVRVSQATAGWNAPCAVLVARAMTQRRLSWLGPLTFVAATLACAISLTTPLVISSVRRYPYGFAGNAGPLYPVAVVELALAMSLPILLALQWRLERRPVERRQLELVLFASCIAGVAYVDTLPVVGVDAPPIGWLPLLIAAIALLNAIVRHRLLDVRLALRRSLGWTLLSVAGAVPFVAIAAWLGPVLTAREPAALAFLYAGLVIGMRGWLASVQPRLEALFGRRTRDLEEELERLSNAAATLKTSEELGRAIDRFLAALDRRLSALVIIDEKGRPRVASSAWGSVPAPARSSPLLAELTHVRALIGRDHPGPARIEVERACLRWGAEFLGPLVIEDDGKVRLLGIIAVSPRQGGGVADAVERGVLDRMCVMVTAALAAARLYERLHALSAELEQKAAARSESLAKTLRDLRGAEQRLVESEKLASLGQIVAGVAADLKDQVRTAYDLVARLRSDAEVLFAGADRVRSAIPSLADPRYDEVARDVAPLLDAVSEGARRALAIASDLSGFASAEESRVPAALDTGDAARSRRPAHLAALIDSTLTLVTGNLADVAVVRDYDEELPPISVETGPLGQVILNLILNATQAMRGSGTLTLSTRRLDGVAELAVADTGPGISKDVLPRIFEPFFSTKGPTTGTGLGLSISYAIVKRHGGRILVESTVGVGTTFRVQLPIG